MVIEICRNCVKKFNFKMFEKIALIRKIGNTKKCSDLLQISHISWFECTSPQERCDYLKKLVFRDNAELSNK